MTTTRPWTVRRVIAAVAVVGLVATPMAAGAATKPKPKPVCKLLTDPVDRAESKSLDIVSADVATDAKLITAVIRVTDLSDTSDPSITLGRKYEISFAVDGGAATGAVYDGPAGTYANYGTAVLDEARNEIRWTAPLKEVEKQRRVTITPGRTKLTSLRAKAFAGVTVPSQVSDPQSGNIQFVDGLYFDDSAAPTSAYIAGTPSCVKVG